MKYDDDVIYFAFGIAALLVLLFVGWANYTEDKKELTITVHPAEVRKLMGDCKGHFKINQETVDGQTIFTVECVK